MELKANKKIHPETGREVVAGWFITLSDNDLSMIRQCLEYVVTNNKKLRFDTTMYIGRLAETIKEAMEMEV